MKIIPTILEKSFEEAERKIEVIKDEVSWIQVDVVDGVFSFGKTFELELLGKLEFETKELLWDIHLMVKKPVKWVSKCNFVRGARVIGQVEMMSDRDEFIKTVKDKNMEAGLAFDIDTKIGEIPDETDVVLLMARKAGFERGSLDERIWKKIQEAKEKGLTVGVDGGVTGDNIEKMKEAGVDVVYCGGAIYSEGNPRENLKSLKEKID